MAQGGVLVDQLEAGETETLPLNADHLWLPGPGGAVQRVPVTLQFASWQAKLRLVREEGTQPWAGTLFCYELGSADPAVNFAWTACSLLRPLARFTLFPDTKGENYLTWLDGGLRLARVSRPRDTLQALRDLFFPPGQTDIMRVPVTRVLGAEPFMGLDSLHADITVRAVVKDAKGRLVVTVTGTDPHKEFTLLLEDGEWRAADPAQGSAPALAAGGSPAERQVTVLEKRVGETRQVDLRGGRLSVVQPDGTATSVAVGLFATRYSLRVRQTVEGETRDDDWSCVQYELKSLDPNVPYSWSFWWRWPLGYPQLVEKEPGEAYLFATFVSDLNIFAVGATTPSLEDYLSGGLLAPSIPVIRVDRMVPEACNWDPDWRNASLHPLPLIVQSAGRDPDGNLEVKIASPDGTQTATLRQKEGAWERIDGGASAG